MILDERPAASSRGCGCFMAIVGVLLVLFGSLFLLTFVSGVASNDDSVTDNAGAFLFLLAVTVLPGFYLIRRSRRRGRTTTKLPGDAARQMPPPIESHSAETSRRIEADEQPIAVSASAPLNATSLLIARPLEMGGRPFTVLFDDEPLGKLRPGETGEWEISPGLHWVTVKTRRQESNTMIVEPRAGDLIRLECRAAGGELTDQVGRSIEGILLERVDS